MSTPETIALNVASSCIYDLFKKTARATGQALKAAFRGWLIDDQTAEILAQKLQEVGIDEDMSAKAIEKRMASSAEMLSLLQQIQKAPVGNTIVNQEHSGSGDNIGIQNNYR